MCDLNDRSVRQIPWTGYLIAKMLLDRLSTG